MFLFLDLHPAQVLFIKCINKSHLIVQDLLGTLLKCWNWKIIQLRAWVTTESHNTKPHSTET